MINKGILLFTGRKSLKRAWEDIIPDSDKKVAIKVNCQITAVYTKLKASKYGLGNINSGKIELVEA